MTRGGDRKYQRTRHNELEDIRVLCLKGTEDYRADRVVIQAALQHVHGYGNVVFGAKTGWVEDIQASQELLVHIRGDFRCLNHSGCTTVRRRGERKGGDISEQRCGDGLEAEQTIREAIYRLRAQDVTGLPY